MARESIHFVCPCCGMHAPIERIAEEGPFVFRMFRKILGGKQKLSDEEKELRKGAAFQRGSGHGALQYDEIEVTDEARDQLRARLEENIEDMAE